MSQDTEDIINFINGRVEVLEDIKNAEPNLKDFIIKSFNHRQVKNKPIGSSNFFSLLRLLSP